MADPPADLTLRDGSRLAVRPIEPADAQRLRDGLDRLSEDSRYRRFLGPKGRFTSAELRYLTELDHHDHEALVALDGEDALAGVARYVRDARRPAEADVAIVVADAWQGRGVGSALLDRLTERAVEEGVRQFTATVLAENEAVVRLLEGVGPLHTQRVQSGEAELLIDLPAKGSRTVLKHALRAAAKGELLMDWRASTSRLLRQARPGPV